MLQFSFISNFFSVPKFLEMPTVSIEITPIGIYYLSLKKSRAGNLPDQYGLIPLAPGDVVGSDIVNKEAVVKALSLIKQKTGQVFVRYSVPEEKTYIFKSKLPNLKPEEVRSVLDFKIEENIPLSSKEVVFDYKIIPNAKNVNQIDVVVSAVAIKYVEENEQMFALAGFLATKFVPESICLAVSVVKPRNEQSLIIANIRESNIVLSLVVSGVVYQTSTINFGSSTINELLSRYYKVSVSEAARSKKDKLYKESPENLEIFSHLINSLSALKDEIFKFITYSNDREDVNNKVEKIILSGSDAQIYNLTNYLSANLNLPVELANVWSNNFKNDPDVPKISKSESLNFAVVNGLSLIP